MVALLRAGEHRSRCGLYNHALHAHRSDTVATAETVGYAYYDNTYSAYFDDSYEPGGTADAADTTIVVTVTYPLHI